MLSIELVRRQDQANAVYDLAYEFIGWLRDRYPEMSEEIETYLAHQNFEAQIRDVLTHFIPPKGECLLALKDGAPVGILMLKETGESTCEMNRMFVRDEARGLGAGRALVARLIERAREMGYSEMTLSALPRHHEALQLYRSCGFDADHRAPTPGTAVNAVLMRIEL